MKNKIIRIAVIGPPGSGKLITEVVLNHVDKECGRGFVLDGFPRTLYQAQDNQEPSAVFKSIYEVLRLPEE